MTQNEDDTESNGTYEPSIADTLTRWRYTLTPTLYVTEESSTSDLLWQQVLEKRAIRGWLVVLWVTFLFFATLGVVALVVLTASEGGR